jgi:hypothetical protein
MAAADGGALIQFIHGSLAFLHNKSGEIGNTA